MDGGGVKGKRWLVVGLEGVMGANVTGGGGETDSGGGCGGCWKIGGRAGGVATCFISDGSDLTMTGVLTMVEAGGVGGWKLKSAEVILNRDGSKLKSVGGVVDLIPAGADFVEVVAGMLRVSMSCLSCSLLTQSFRLLLLLDAGREFG